MMPNDMTSWVIVLGGIIFLANLQLDKINVPLCHTLSNVEYCIKLALFLYSNVGHRGRDRMVVGFTICNQCLLPLMFWIRILMRARCTTLRDKVCQWLVTGRWFSLGPPVSSTNKTDRYNWTEILLKVALNTIKQTVAIKKTNRFL